MCARAGWGFEARQESGPAVRFCSSGARQFSASAAFFCSLRFRFRVPRKTEDAEEGA